MTHRRYQQFEINGKITLEKFIDVLRGLNALDEIQHLLELGDNELFKEKNSKKTIKTSSNNKKETEEVNEDCKIVNIPDVFS
jgi:Ser-tRNA(Ala) deacylase AlaX